MQFTEADFGRRELIALSGLAFAGALLPSTAHAGLGITNLLAKASDGALDKLGLQDGFYNDLAVRILLPGTKGKLVRSLLRTGDKLGLTTKLTKGLNDAASLAAKEAKPIFRDAISGLSFSDVPGIATQRDGATQYLRRSAGDTLRGKVQPLVVSALGTVGAFNRLDTMAQSGGALGQFVSLAKLNRASLSESVTDQALNGIFSYIGNGEAGLRGKITNIGDLLGGIIK
jgi:Protein of unknown function (DUF4197)